MQRGEGVGGDTGEQGTGLRCAEPTPGPGRRQQCLRPEPGQCHRVLRQVGQGLQNLVSQGPDPIDEGGEAGLPHPGVPPAVVLLVVQTGGGGGDRGVQRRGTVWAGCGVVEDVHHVHRRGGEFQAMAAEGRSHARIAEEPTCLRQRVGRRTQVVDYSRHH